MIGIVIALLLIQGAMGAFDVFYNHEWEARLRSRESARLELAIHSVRAVLYAVLFGGVAWFEFRGAWAWVFGALIAIEIGLTLWDFVVEDQTRKLTPVERITHTVLAMNGGAYVGFIVYIFATDWALTPTALTPVSYGWQSWVLSAYALGVFLSGVADGVTSMAMQHHLSFPAEHGVSHARGREPRS